MRAPPSAVVTLLLTPSRSVGSRGGRCVYVAAREVGATDVVAAGRIAAAAVVCGREVVAVVRSGRVGAVVRGRVIAPEVGGWVRAGALCLTRVVPAAVGRCGRGETAVGDLAGGAGIDTAEAGRGVFSFSVDASLGTVKREGDDAVLRDVFGEGRSPVGEMLFVMLALFRPRAERGRDAVDDDAAAIAVADPEADVGLVSTAKDSPRSVACPCPPSPVSPVLRGCAELDD